MHTNKGVTLMHYTHSCTHLWQLGRVAVDHCKLALHLLQQRDCMCECEWVCECEYVWVCVWVCMNVCVYEYGSTFSNHRYPVTLFVLNVG
jgi:hypothetical protein